MNKEALNSFLHAFMYPGINRTLGELKLIGSIDISSDHARIELLTASEESYILVKQALEQALSSHFKSLDIYKKTVAKKDMNYGNTHTPNNRAPYAKNVIAVTSGKGGVGKSTVSVNIAIALAQRGYSVGLLDADVYGPNIPRMTQTDHERLQWNDNNKIIPSENYGIKIMSVGLTTPAPDTPLVWRSSVAVSALIQFLEDVDWGMLDFLVIDMPPGTGDIQLTMAEELPITASILVTTPQIVATDDVSRAIMMYKDIKVPMAGIVENMSYFIAPDTKQRYDIFGKGGGEKIAQKYDVNFLGQIPLDMEIREYSDKGKPAVAKGNERQKIYYTQIIDAMFKTITFNL
jgi:ATP-binding protein involved in chromosome partitioning